MKKILALAVVLASAGFASNAKAANTSWTLGVTETLGTTSYNAGNGGEVRIGLNKCTISQPFLLTIGAQRFESVAVSCDLGLGSHATVSTICATDGGDRGVARLSLNDSLGSVSLVLICRN